ncbi:MAG: UbiA family prenyltransferase [Acidobacteria bacterium]|nr:UbiA family prenyltransferase [Acidobacteriota bacterium]
MSLPDSIHTVTSPDAPAGVARGSTIQLLSSALRVHQWIKNLLIFVPLLMAHKIFDGSSLVRTASGFLAWCLCASGVYLLNDWFDLEDDRQHPYKMRRPLAAGTLNDRLLWLLVPALFLSGLSIAFLVLPLSFGWTLLLYIALTTSYSAYLKQLLIVDVLVLAALYTLRMLSGGFATGIPVSPWLLAFSMFLFLSLAFVKRYTELGRLESASSGGASRRNYRLEDIEIFRTIGPASGYLSVLVLVLYINSPQVASLYRQPIILWLVGPCLLYWITRVWLLAHRGEMHEDPIVFTLKDPASYIVGALVTAVIIAATLL